MAKFALEGALRSHRELGLAQEDEWLFLALAYLRICAQTPSTEVAEDSQALEAVMTELVKGSKSTKGAFERKASYLAGPLLR